MKKIDMVSLKVTSASFSVGWLTRMFLDVLPFPIALRIFDVFMHQGHKVHLKIGLALLSHAKDRLLKTRSSFAFLSCLTDSAKSLNDPARLFKRAWRFKVSSSFKSAAKSKIKANRKLSHSKPPQASTSAPIAAAAPTAPKLKDYYPTITFKSRLMTSECWNYIYNWMPMRFTIRDPVLLHSNDQEGISLMHIYKTLGQYEPTLVVIKSKQERVRHFKKKKKKLAFLFLPFAFSWIGTRGRLQSPGEAKKWLSQIKVLVPALQCRRMWLGLLLKAWRNCYFASSALLSRSFFLIVL